MPLTAIFYFYFYRENFVAKGTGSSDFRAAVYKKVNQIEILYACTCYRNIYRGINVSHVSRT